MSASQMSLVFDEEEHKAAQNAERQAHFKEFWRSSPTSSGHLQRFYARWAEFELVRVTRGHDDAILLFGRWREEDRGLRA